MTYQFLIFEVKIDVVNRRNVHFGKDLLHFLLLLSFLSCIGHLLRFLLSQSLIFWEYGMIGRLGVGIFHLLFQDLEQTFALDLFEIYIIVLFNEGIESVLYLVLWSSRQVLAYLRPFASYFAVNFQNFTILVLTPVFFFNFGIQLINKPLSNLLSIFTP